MEIDNLNLECNYYPLKFKHKGYNSIKNKIPSAFIKLPLKDLGNNIFTVIEESNEMIKKDLLIAKRNSQNRLTVQEMMCIAILNNLNFTFFLSKPYKKSLNTMQFIHIDKIMKNNEILWDSTSVNLEGKNSKQKKIVYDTAISNFMIKLMKQENIICKERITRKGLKEDFVQLKRLEYIEWNSSLIYLNQCNSIGSNIYMNLQQRMQKQSIILSGGDNEINELFTSFTDSFQIIPQSPSNSTQTNQVCCDEIPSFISNGNRNEMFELYNLVEN